MTCPIFCCERYHTTTRKQKSLIQHRFKIIIVALDQLPFSAEKSDKRTKQTDTYMYIYMYMHSMTLIMLCIHTKAMVCYDNLLSILHILHTYLVP